MRSSALDIIRRNEAGLRSDGVPGRYTAFVSPDLFARLVHEITEKHGIATLDEHGRLVIGRTAVVVAP